MHPHPPQGREAIETPDWDEPGVRQPLPPRTDMGRKPGPMLLAALLLLAAVAALVVVL